MTWRNLVRQRLRTSLTVVGVAVGVVAIVALGTIVRGLWASTEQVIHAADADMLVYQRDAVADLFSRLDEAATRAALEAIPETAEVTPGISFPTRLGDQKFVLLLGIHLDQFQKQKAEIVGGRTVESADEVVIGSILERVLSRTVGDDIELGGRTYRIVGVFHSNIIFLDAGITMALPRLQELIGMEGQVMFFSVRLHAGAEPSEVVEKIEKALPHVVAIDNVGDYKKVDFGLELASDMIWIITFIATVVGAIIVTNTMWASVYDRTREIGVLRAVGWSRSQIVTMIVCESASIALLAGVVGCLLGAALAEFTAALPIARQFARPVYEAPTFVLAFGMAITLGIVGGLAPAWRAAGISPVEALRHE